MKGSDVMEKMKCAGTSLIPSDAEFIRWSDEAAAMVEKYNWYDREVMPWSWLEKVTDIIAQVASGVGSTNGSKQMLWSLANGLTDIMNHWENTELNGVTIQNLKTGKTFKVDKDMADIFFESEYHVIID